MKMWWWWWWRENTAMFVTGIMRLFEVIVRGEFRKEYLWKRSYYAANQKHAFPTPLRKDDARYLLSWFFILAFTTRTFAFFMLTLTLFFNQIYLSLHFDEYT